MARPVCHPARPRRRAHQGLNSQTARSNVASTTLRKARGSITRSEKDVAQLEVNTADGRTLDVSTAQVGVLGDVAFVTVDGTLPVSANLEGQAPEGADVAGVVYAIEIATGLGLAIPMDTVNALIDDGGLEAVPACGQE